MGIRSRKGNRIGKQTWSNVFHHRFYIGETWLKLGDVPTKGNHQPLIDVDTFSQVQQVLKSHDKNKQRTQRHKYLLSGLLYSVDADSQCWSEANNRKKLSYYRSRSKVNGSQVYYNSRVIDEQIPEIFRRLTITEDTRQELRNELSRFFNAKLDGEGQLKASETRMAKLERMEKNLQRLYVEEEIALSDFKEHRAIIEAERSRLKNMIESIRQRQHLVKADFEVADELVTQFDFLYENGSFEQKRLLCETVLKRLYRRREHHQS